MGLREIIATQFINDPEDVRERVLHRIHRRIAAAISILASVKPLDDLINDSSNTDLKILLEIQKEYIQHTNTNHSFHS